MKRVALLERELFLISVRLLQHKVDGVSIVDDSDRRVVLALLELVVDGREAHKLGPYAHSHLALLLVQMDCNYASWLDCVISVLANKIVKLPGHVRLAIEPINQKRMRVVAVEGVHVVLKQAG